MICAINNAYPNNNCVNGSSLPEFKFTYYGDETLGANFQVYSYPDYQKIVQRQDANGYCNGEEIGIKSWGATLAQDKEYVWQATLYEKIDIANGWKPTVYVNDGATQSPAFIDVTVQEFAVAVDEIYIPIGTGYDIPIPCYVKYGDVFKTVVAYDGMCIKLGSKFSTYPSVGDEMIICKYRSTKGHNFTSSNTLFIETGLNFNSSTRALSAFDSSVSNTYIKIDDSYYGIVNYAPTTGALALNSATTGINVGTNYELYSTYVKSPYFYFTTKAVPTVTPSMEFSSEVIKCTASITTAGNFPIKYYYWSIYKDDTLINQSEKIYSGRLQYLFREIETNTTYTGKITIVTQDNVEVTSSGATCTISASQTGISNLKAEFDNSKKAIKLTWTNTVTPTAYMIVRKSSDNSLKYLETLTKLSTTYYDYSCASNESYTYIVIPKTSSAVYAQSTATISTSFKDWSIYFLDEIDYERPDTSITDIRIFYDYMWGDKQFKVGSVWNLQVDVQSDEFTHNIGRELVNSVSGKPAVTYGNQDYDTFSLSFLLGNVSCPTYGLTGYDQNTFNVWKAQVNSSKPVLIKDTKGNVWYGAITAHTYSIDYSMLKYQPYNITIEFSQLRNMNKTRILTD